MRNSGKTAILLCAALAPVALGKPVMAGDSDWQIFSQRPNGDIHFFDASRVETTANVHQVWNRIRYKTSVMGAQSYQSLLELDCAGSTEKILQNTFFSDKNWEKPSISTDKSDRPAQPIQDGSASEELLTLICGQ